MQRRALFTAMATGAAGLAGCVGRTDDDQRSPEKQTNATASPNGNQAGRNGSAADGSEDDGGDVDGSDDGDSSRDGENPFDEAVSVVELKTAPRTLALGDTEFHTDDGARVRLEFAETATDDHPAVLTGTLRNENDYANTFEFEAIPAVGAVHGRPAETPGADATLHLAPTENHDLAETVPQAHRNQNGYWQTGKIDHWIESRRRLEPGAELQLEYHVAGDARQPGLPTGRYQFPGDEDVRISVWNTDQPGPTEESRFAGRSVPPVSDEVTIQWFHDADESTPTYLRPARERVDLDGAIDFELVNNSHESVGCGHWNLHKLVDGEWFHVGPTIHMSICRSLVPGARSHWALEAFNGEPVPANPGSFGNDGLTIGYLGGGTYAVVAGYGHPADQSGALLELVGDPVSLSLTETATLQRDGDTAIVTTGVHGDGEHPSDATLVVERTAADAAGDVDRMIPEQLLGNQTGVGSTEALRNGLAAVESGVERVEVRTDEHGADAAPGFDGSTQFVEFQGHTYELTAEGTGS